MDVTVGILALVYFGVMLYLIHIAEKNIKAEGEKVHTGAVNLMALFWPLWIIPILFLRKHIIKEIRKNEK